MLSGYVKRVKSALKRSFEVEETDTSTHPSPLSRRTTNPLRSSTSSTSSQRSYDLSSRNSDYSSSRSSPSESSNPRSPKTGMRRIELSGGRNPDTASSRRTEISIEVSSKQIDNSPSAGIARFGLKRPEVSLSSRSSALDSSSNSSSTNRRAELSMTRPHEPPAPPKRMDAQLSSAPVSRIPEPPQRRAEPPSPILSPAEGASRRPEMPVFRQPDGLVPNSAMENNNHLPPAPSAPLPSLAEPRVERVQSPVTEAPTARPTDKPGPVKFTAATPTSNQQETLSHRPWTAARNAVRGQPGSPILRLPIHDTILAQRGPETSAAAIGFLSPHTLSLQNEDLFIWKRPCPQQGSYSVNKGARQVMSDQTNDGWLTLHAHRVHSGVSVFKKKLGRGGKENLLFFFLTKGPS